MLEESFRDPSNAVKFATETVDGKIRGPGTGERGRHKSRHRGTGGRGRIGKVVLGRDVSVAKLERCLVVVC